MPGHAIITGGSSGIGLAIAKSLSSRGASVSLIARNRDRLAAARDAVLAAGNGRAAVQTFSADVRDPDDLKQAIASAADGFGPPDWAHLMCRHRHPRNLRQADAARPRGPVAHQLPGLAAVHPLRAAPPREGAEAEARPHRLRRRLRRSLRLQFIWPGQVRGARAGGEPSRGAEAPQRVRHHRVSRRHRYAATAGRN